MFRLVFLSVLFAAACAVPINDDSKSVDHDVIVVDNIDNYLAENPGLEVFEELAREQIQGVEKIKYKFGKLSEGDFLTFIRTYDTKNPKESNFRTTFDYPPKSIEALNITYVDIAVDQTSKLGRAYIVSGGIGQREISVVVEAQQTTIFRLIARVFGRK